MSALTVLDLDGGVGDEKRVAFFLDDFFKFCSDRLVVLQNGDSCKFYICYYSYSIVVGVYRGLVFRIDYRTSYSCVL